VRNSEGQMNPVPKPTYKKKPYPKVLVAIERRGIKQREGERKMRVGQKVKTIDGKEGKIVEYRPALWYVGFPDTPGLWYLGWQLQPIEDKCPKCGKSVDLTPKEKGKPLCSQCEAPLKSDIFTICEKCWAIEKQALREKFVFKSEPEQTDWFVVGKVCQHMTKPQALKRMNEVCCANFEYRIFKWSQGITG